MCWTVLRLVSSTKPFLSSFSFYSHVSLLLEFCLCFFSTILLFQLCLHLHFLHTSYSFIFTIFCQYNLLVICTCKDLLFFLGQIIESFKIFSRERESEYFLEVQLVCNLIGLAHLFLALLLSHLLSSHSLTISYPELY